MHCLLRIFPAVSPRLTLRDGDGPGVSAEGVVDDLLVGPRGQEADHRHDDQTGHHGERAAVDRALEEGREGGAEEEVQRHDAGAEAEADPDGGQGGALHVQAVEEGGQERAGMKNYQLNKN